jgi:hypothetical protein
MGEGSVKLWPVAAAAMVGILLAGPAAAQTRRYVGRPVADVLIALQSPELSFIFTNDSVPQALLVISEPKGRNNRDIAEQILAEHCLALKRGPGRLMIVVQGKCPAAKKPVKAPESISVVGESDPLRVVDYPDVIVSGQAGQAGQLINPATREGTYTLPPSTVLEMAGALDNVSHALGKLPSVTAVPGQDSKLAVRGAGPEHNMVVVDGVQIHNPYRLGTFTSSFLNPATAAGVRLDPSGLDARYGGRLSSVTLIDLRDGVKDRALAVSGSIGMMAGDLLLEGRLPGNDGASWWAAARGTSHRPLFNRFSDDQVPGFADVQVKTTLLPTEHTRLTFYGLVGREMSDERDQVIPAYLIGIGPPTGVLIEGEKYTGINRLAVMNLSWTAGPKLAATTTASTYTHEARERDDSSVDPGLPPYQRDLLVRDHSLRQRVQFRPGGDQLLDTGVEVHWLQSQWRMDGRTPWVNSWESGPRPRGLGPTTEGELVEYTDGPIDTRLLRTQIGWWTQYRLPLGSRMALEPGVRLDWNSFTSEAVWQPRVRLSGRVRSSIWWTGYAEQAQTPSHESLQGYDYVQLTAADGGRLKSERSRQIVAGIEGKLSGDFTLRIEAYGRRFDHLLVQRLETDEQIAMRLSRLKIPTDLPADSMVYEARPTVVADSIGRGSSKGLEVQLERTAGMVRGFVSYNYSRSTREMYGDTFPFDFDRPHSVKAVLFMQPWRRVRVAVTSERGSGVPVTPLISESFYRQSDGSFSMTLNPGMRRPSLRNTERLNGYGRTDVRVTWSTLGHWEFYAEMLNVFGEEIVHHVEMPPSVGPRAVDWEVARSDRWLPSFGLRVKF